MADLTNLPHDITPADFFKLVDETLANEAAPDNARPEKAQITLSGDGGGSWTSGFADGRLVVEEGTTENPPVALTLSVDDWRAFVAGKVRDALKEHVDQALIDPKALSKLYASADKVDQVMALKGNLQAVIEDGDTTYTATVTTGGIAPDTENPTARIVVALPDFVLIASGQENPQMAFFSGKIRVEGDMNHVMGLFALTM